MEVYIQELGEFVFTYAIFIVTGILLVGLCIAAVPNRDPRWWLEYRPKGYKAGARKMRKEEEHRVNGLATYGFVDHIETLVYNEEITRKQATEIYRKLRQLFPIRSMFPSNEWLKTQIKRRLGSHVTAKFTDKKEVKEKEVPKKRRNMLDPTPERVVL